jgi:hypothetical protein
MLPAQTLHVSIDRPPAQVAQFVADPRNLPRWATAFCRSVRQAGGDWWVTTTLGEVNIRFAAANRFGILDHEVTLPDGAVVTVPMRVIANGAGSEVLFTLFRQPHMSDQEFAADRTAVQQDLATLKHYLEHRGGD